jgi:PAS domain-containing protein
MADNNHSNETQIRKLVENWAKAVRDGDMQGVLAHHADDIVTFDVPPPLQSKGMAEYKKTWDLFFQYSPGGEGRSEPSAHPEEFFNFLLEHTPDQVYFKDRDGRFLRASRAVAEYLDVADPHEIIGKSDFDFFPPGSVCGGRAEDHANQRTHGRKGREACSPGW